MSRARPRLVHLMADGDLAGGASYLLRLIPMLDAEYGQVLVTSPGWLVAQLEGTTCGTVELPMTGRKHGVTRVVPALRRAIATLQPGIVVAHGTRAGWLACLALGRTRRPFLIYTNHGLSYGLHKPPLESVIMRRVERFITRRADLVTAVAPHLCAALERHRGGPVVYTPYGLPLPGTDPARPPAIDDAGGSPVHVVMVGRLIPSKDPLTFAHAAARVLARYRDGVRFSLVGRGPLEARVRRTIESARIGDRFVLQQGRAEGIIASSQVFCLPSHSEGLSIALLEAMSYGCAVVATDMPPSRDLIDPGVNGLLFPRGDADALADCLERCCAQPEFRRRLGQAARERLARDFSPEGMAARWLEALAAARAA